MKVIIRFFALTLLLSSCGTKKIQQDGYAHLRELPVIKPKYSEELTVNYRMYASSRTTSICFVEVNPAALLIKRDSVDNWSRNASFKLVVKKNSLAKEILFQSEKTWTFEGNKSFVDSFRFELPAQEDVWFEITYSDLNKHTYFQEQRWWIRKKQLTQQHFALLDPERKNPLINAYCKGDTLAIQSHYFNDSLVDFLIYKNLDKPAMSPFGFGSGEPDFQKPDSSFTERFVDNQLNIPLNSGFVLIKKTEHLDQVAGFFTHSEDSLTAAYQSMAYICSAAEIETLKDPSKVRAVYEQFWSKAGGNDKEKTERLKKEFIRRVEYANLHFSSYKLGCLTDRGMIYIVYGEPERILKEGFQEIWSYKSSGIDHTNFVFIYDQEQMAPNNGYLERSPHYKSTYYIAVENWRQGLISF